MSAVADTAVRKRIITVVSGKGGTGKSTVTANLGAALALLGKSVLLVDADVGLKNLDLYLGVEQYVTFDLSDLIAGKCRKEQAIVRHPVVERLAILPAALCRDKEDVDIDRFVESVKAVSEDFDYTLIDSPHGIGNSFKMTVFPAHQVIVCTTPERASVIKCDKIVGLVEDVGLAHAQILLVINKIEEQLRRDGYQMSAAQVLDILKLRLVTEIPFDYDLFDANVEGRPVVLKSESVSSKIFLQAARLIDGEAVEPHVIKSGGSILGKIFGGGPA